ncbi:hypothetical protein NEHOM01_1648 [Nematocida homosporus]|uniref:uncharacterized protein n=1 Tax=Nematocida homosporus TaxID=1912981 RepID=UPI002220F8B8|nr:uncharacterized protein NEHOM01_1648 [Nematocida homosporus]KAI5186709.1 hypothetical protein NEHOM01_1648 [Nematocida homosporus]
MFRFLKAIRVKRSYLWVGALLVSLGLASAVYCLWQLNMKVTCSDAEQPESSLPNPIGQVSGRMEVDRVDSAIQVEENNPPTPPLTPLTPIAPTPSNPIAPTPPLTPLTTPSNPIAPVLPTPPLTPPTPIAPTPPLTPLTTPSNPITPVRVSPVFRTLPPEVKPIVAQLQLLQMINDPVDHTWLPHQTQDNTLQWILMLNPEKMALSNEPARKPIQYNRTQPIIIPKSWKETEYNRCFEELTPLQRITGQAPVAVLGLQLEYGQASFKLLLLLLRILSMPRVEVDLYGHLQLDESHQARQMLAGIDYLLENLPDDISGRKTILHIHTPGPTNYWGEFGLIIHAYRNLDLKKVSC